MPRPRVLIGLVALAALLLIPFAAAASGTARITEPAPGSSVSGTVTFTATLTGPAPQYVDWRLDGSLRCHNGPLGPFSCTIDTGAYPAGQHTWQITARWGSGKNYMKDTAVYTFTAEPPPPPPPPACADGLDNDGDGLVDMADTLGCESTLDNDETDPAPPPPPPPPGPACTKTWSSGTPAAFMQSLVPGDVGCFPAGTYTQSGAAVKIINPNVTIRSAPGEQAVYNGAVWFSNTANGGTLRDITVHGAASTNAWAVLVQGDDVTVGPNVTMDNLKAAPNTTNAICVLAGQGYEGSIGLVPANVAWRLRVVDNRIHDCGDDDHEHSLYLEHTRDAYVADNVFVGNGGYAVHMYPDAQASVLEHNVFSDNSENCKANLTFSGQGPPEYDFAYGSANNLVRYNLITFPVCRYNVESYYPSQAILGTGNEVAFNCVYGAPAGDFGTSTPGRLGYTQHDNLIVDPLYVNRAARDYRLQAGSPCTGWGPR